MAILPGWMQSFGAAGATRNAAAACEQQRAQDRALDARLQAFAEAERVRRAAASRPARIRRADAA